MLRRIVGRVRRCIQDYQMLEPGGSVAVGLSGGKDSLVLLLALNELRRYDPARFTLEAITLDMGFEGVDLSAMTQFLENMGLRHTVVQTHLADTIRTQTGGPCALCAHLRRGILHKTARALHCRTVALGHHFDDAVETVMMSLLGEGRIHCFRPVTMLPRAEVKLIRPMLYVEEKDIGALAKDKRLPVVHNPCPANGHSARSAMKALITRMERDMPGVKHRVFSAMRKYPLAGWASLDR